MLAIITKMTLTQVSTWFANARRRLKKENKMTWEPKNKTEDDDDGLMSDDEKEKDVGGGGMGDGVKPLQQQQQPGGNSDTFGKRRHLICSWDIDPRRACRLGPTPSSCFIV